MHRRQWVCEEHRKTFPSAETMTKHLEETHPTALTPRQIRALVNIAERAFEEASVVKCPFCPNERQLKMIRSHIAGHMESIALFVLPSTEGDDEDDGGEEDPSKSSESVNDSEIDLSPAATGDGTRTAAETAETSAYEALIVPENPWSQMNTRLVSTDDQMSTAADPANIPASERKSIAPENPLAFEPISAAAVYTVPNDYHQTREPAFHDRPGPANLATPSIVSITPSDYPDVLVCQQEGCAAMYGGKYRLGTLQRHMRHKHGVQRRVHDCEDPDCNKSFVRSDARLKHYRMSHPYLAPKGRQPRPKQTKT
jgi:hypothetical protein